MYEFWPQLFEGCIYWISQLVLVVFICWMVIYLAPVVLKVDNAIYRTNHYTLESAVGSAITYPLDSDLSG